MILPSPSMLQGKVCVHCTYMYTCACEREAEAEGGERERERERCREKIYNDHKKCFTYLYMYVSPTCMKDLILHRTFLSWCWLIKDQATGAANTSKLP